jgi:hypothetical protein
VGVGLEVGDCLLPVGCEDVFVLAMETLIDLFVKLASIVTRKCGRALHSPMRPSRNPRLVHSLEPKAVFVSVDSEWLFSGVPTAALAPIVGTRLAEADEWKGICKLAACQRNCDLKLTIMTSMIDIIDRRRIALRLLPVGRTRWILIHLLVLSRLSRSSVFTRCTVGARQDVGGRQCDCEVGKDVDSRVVM